MYMNDFVFLLTTHVCCIRAISTRQIFTCFHWCQKYFWRSTRWLKFKLIYKKMKMFEFILNAGLPIWTSDINWRFKVNALYKDSIDYDSTAKKVSFVYFRTANKSDSRKPRSRKIFTKILIESEPELTIQHFTIYGKLLVYEKTDLRLNFRYDVYFQTDKQKIDYLFESGRSLNTQLPELCTNS